MSKNNFEMAEKFIEKVLDLNFILFPYLSLITIFVLLLESVTYPGFVANHFFMSSVLIFCLFILSGVFSGLTYISSQSKKDVSVFDKYVLLKNIFLLILPIILILLFIFRNYTNLQRYSILFGSGVLFYPSRVVIALGCMIYFLGIYSFFMETKYRNKFSGYFAKIKEMFSKKSAIDLVSTSGFIFVILFIVMNSTYKDLPFAKFNVGFLLKHTFYTYDQKMFNQIGPDYNYYLFIDKYTPNDAVIMHPKQQGQWGDVSNEGYSRYFIYPRNLVSEDVDPSLKDQANYVMIIGGKNLVSDHAKQNRWPDFNVPAKEIILYNFDITKPPIILYSDYNYKTFKYPDYWGLIVVDKERAKW